MPPVTRRKRQLITSSPDDEEDSEPRKPKVSRVSLKQTSPQPIPTLNRNGSSNGAPSQADTTSPQKGKSSSITPSPSKLKSPKSNRKSPKKPPADANNKQIKSFFNTTTQEQFFTDNKRSLSVKENVREEVLDDILDDLSNDDDLIASIRADSFHSVRQASQASQNGHSHSQDHKPARTHARSNGLSAPVLKRFKGSQSSEKGGELYTLNDQRPWAERFSPIDLEELAVHKKKVADIRSWLEDAFRRTGRKRLLILKGPAGSGKTTTIRMLSKDLGFGILEWRNPLGGETSAGYSIPPSAQFQEFLGRAGRQGSLHFQEDVETHETASGVSTKLESDFGQKVMLVEEFPNTFSRASNTLTGFKSTILEYLTRSTPSLGSLLSKGGQQSSTTPLVLVISETLLTTSSASADSFTAHRLLGPDILNHAGTTVIEFNPIAPTFLTKALELVIQKEARVSGRQNVPGPMVLSRLCEIGDVRNAIGSLEFLCSRGDLDVEWGGRVNFGKKKKPKGETASLTKMEQDSLELVTQREASLGIFHAVGKVVYNKREAVEASSNEEVPAQPPEYLSNHFRLKRSAVSVDSLIDETGTDNQTFIAALHENYILSCESSSTEETLESVAECMDLLSDSDMLQYNGSSENRSGRRGRFTGITFQGTRTDNLRQEELAFNAAVRGLLFALPIPVKRKPMSNSRSISSSRGSTNKGDAFKMFYPESMRLWRRIEEVQESIDTWKTRLFNGLRSFLSQRKNDVRTGGTVESWGRRRLNDVDVSQNTPTDEVSESIGLSSQEEMALVLLPSIAQILTADPQHSAAVRELRGLTQMRGHSLPTDDNSDAEEDEPRQADWVTDKALGPDDSPAKRTPWLSSSRGKSTNTSSFSASDQPDQYIDKLVLSDDDIEG